MQQDFLACDLALFEARLGNRPARLGATTEFRSIGHFSGMRRDGQRAVMRGFGIKLVSHPNTKLAVQRSFERDQRHLKAWGELVLQLFALALVVAGGLPFLLPSLQVEAGEFGDCFIPARL